MCSSREGRFGVEGERVCLHPGRGILVLKVCLHPCKGVPVSKRETVHLRPCLMSKDEIGYLRPGGGGRSGIEEGEGVFGIAIRGLDAGVTCGNVFLSS